MKKFVCPYCEKEFDKVAGRNGHIAHCAVKKHGVQRIILDKDGNKLKYCPECKQHKPLDKFRNNVDGIEGKMVRCRACMLATEEKERERTKPIIGKLHKSINPQFGISIPELMETEDGHIARSKTVHWDGYQDIIQEFEELGYRLEKSRIPDTTVYDTISDSQELVVLCSDQSMSFWLTTAKGQVSNREALKFLLLEA